MMGESLRTRELRRTATNPGPDHGILRPSESFFAPRDGGGGEGSSSDLKKSAGFITYWEQMSN